MQIKVIVHCAVLYLSGKVMGLFLTNSLKSMYGLYRNSLGLRKKIYSFYHKVANGQLGALNMEFANVLALSSDKRLNVPCCTCQIFLRIICRPVNLIRCEFKVHAASY